MTDEFCLVDVIDRLEQSIQSNELYCNQSLFDQFLIIHNQSTPFQFIQAIQYAMGNGYVNALRELTNLPKSNHDRSNLYAAVVKNNVSFDTFKCLWQHYPMEPTNYYRGFDALAAQATRWDILRWIRDGTNFASGLPWSWTPQVILGPAESGQLDMLKWMIIDQGCPLSFLESAEYLAIKNGHLHVVQWFVSEFNLKLDHFYQKIAACGHLHILKWMVENHYPWHCKILRWAGEYGHMHIVNWILAQGLPYEVEYDFKTYLSPHKNYHAARFQCLYSGKWKWVNAIDTILFELIPCTALQELIKNYI